MEEFAVDLDKVLDDFEQSEGGNASEADGVRPEEIPDDVEKAELDHPRLACDFPVLEVLDFDLSEADFALSNFDVSIASKEGNIGQNVSDPEPDAENLPTYEADAMQNNDNDGHYVPGVVEFQLMAQIPDEVDVLSACRHAIVNPSGLFEPPLVQEHREHEVENAVVPALPPDIVCSAPDLVSSAMVGVDVVPLSCTNASIVGNVGLNLDLTVVQTVSDAICLNLERPDASIPGVPNLDIDPAVSPSSSPAGSQEHRDLPSDQSVLESAGISLTDENHVGEPSDQINSNAEELKVEETHTDVVPHFQSSYDDSSGIQEFDISNKTPAFPGETDKSKPDVAYVNFVVASSGLSQHSDVPHGISEATVSSDLSSDVAFNSGAQPFQVADQENKHTADITDNNVEVCSSDINEKVIRNPESGVPAISQELLPDIYQVSVCGVESEMGRDLTFSSQHESSCGRLDESSGKDTEYKMSANSNHFLPLMNRNDCDPETSFFKNKMPPAYWDDGIGDEHSCKKFGILSNKFSQIDGVLDDKNFIDKINNGNLGEESYVTSSSKINTGFSGIDNAGYPYAEVEKDFKQEAFSECPNDPEIIANGNVADTNFANVDDSQSAASVNDGTCTLHLRKIQSAASSAVESETFLSEYRNLGEEVKRGLDLVSDVVMLESLPEFHSTGDVSCPDVAVSDSNAIEVKCGLSEDDGFTMVNGHSAQLPSAAISNGQFPEVFGILEDEAFKNLMNEVAEEMEKMISRENIDAELAGSHGGMNGLDVLGLINECNEAERNLNDISEDPTVLMQHNGTENRQMESKSILEVGKEASGDESCVLNRLAEASRTSLYHQKETSFEKKLNSQECLSTDAEGGKTRLPFFETHKEDIRREAASNANGSQVYAINENNLSPAELTQKPLSSDISAGARQKQVKTVEPESISVATSVQALPEEAEGMPVDVESTWPTNAAALAMHGSQLRQASILLASASPPDTASPTIPFCSNIELELTRLGKVAPVWLPDAEASKCMECEVAFSFTRRRHHCRACGKVFCHGCSSLRATLPYLENKQDRVCSKCYQDLVRASYYERTIPNAGTRPNMSDSDSPPGQAQASSESQYQPPIVVPPTGVLRKQGSMKLSGEAKQVMFSDGVRPGGALTELDGSSEARTTSSRRSRKSDKSSSLTTPTSQTRNSADTRHTSCLIPNTGHLPPVIIPAANGEFSLKDNVPPDIIFQQLSSAQDSSPVMFAINRDLAVLVKIVNLDCCVNRLCWCFTTKGLCNVGQDEIVIVLECLPDEKTVPIDILRHLHVVYEMASHGSTIANLDHTVLPTGSLGCQEIGGFLYIRQTFQCLQKLILPDPPYLFGILLQKYEMSWAKVFPLRLVFRLGAEFRYYPSPLISVRNRKAVYGEVGHTIMNLLADFHNYQYMVPRISGLVIHMEDKRTTISIPRNRYKMIMKVLSNSDDHVLALGASFSPTADSHLVCLQREDGNYQTQAINIQNRPRQITGACFIVFNGALKLTSGLRAKSSIVEDGVMVQVTSDAMTELKQALNEMKNYKILCGSIEIAQPDEMVVIEWKNEEKNINLGVKSPIDGLSMFGVDSIRIHGSTDYAKEKLSIRWTEVYVLRSGAAAAGTASHEEAPANISHLAESLAEACSQALISHLSQLAFEMFTKIGLRVTIDSEQVGYEVGSRGVRLPDYCTSDLDEKLIGVIHGAASSTQSGPIVLELIFRILHPYGMCSDTDNAPATN